MPPECERELALEAQEGLHSCGRPRGVLHSWRNIHRWHGKRINKSPYVLLKPVTDASQLAAGVIATRCNICHRILSQTKKRQKNTSTLILILLEGTISDKPNSFSHPPLGKMKSWASHGLLEKVEQISISFCLLNWITTASLPQRHGLPWTTVADGSCRSCRQSLQSQKATVAKAFSTGASCLLRSKQSSSMFKLDGLNRKKTQIACLKEPTARRVGFLPDMIMPIFDMAMKPIDNDDDDDNDDNDAWRLSAHTWPVGVWLLRWTLVVSKGTTSAAFGERHGRKFEC